MNNVIIVTYDISNNKTRTHFSKFLEKYGVRVQFSVYEIQNSKRILDIVQNAIQAKFKKRFESGDSVYLFKANHNDTIRYGSAALIDKDLIIL
ncbi:MAG: CRISPR-associated endonuclease Cas2 [Bacteroidetes bacterium HGW-Bacteroidetes-12]|nr:MAG: CRISPR-associated endonuclease Cas2 [Bacteroidetes bacterium HGW-Bacteroidetes-12]